MQKLEFGIISRKPGNGRLCRPHSSCAHNPQLAQYKHKTNSTRQRMALMCAKKCSGSIIVFSRICFFACTWKIRVMYKMSYDIKHPLSHQKRSQDWRRSDCEDVWVVWALGMLATAITDHIVGLRRRPNSTTINASTNIYSNFSNLSASTNAHILLVEQH